MDKIVGRLIDFLLPRRCPMCDKVLDYDERPVCLECNLKLPRYDNHVTDDGEYELAKLYYGKAKVNKAFAFMRFLSKSQSAKVVYALKYTRYRRVGVELGIMMAQEAGDRFFEGIDCIVPVPITARRRMWRGYNQSEAVAQGISKITGIPVEDACVIRTTFKGSQTALDNVGRSENVRDVFLVVDPDVLKDKHVLVIDDVLTTGATTSSLLKKMYASSEMRDASVMAISKAR